MSNGNHTRIIAELVDLRDRVRDIEMRLQELENEKEDEYGTE